MPEVLHANKDEEEEEKIHLSFLPSTRLEEGLQKVGIRDDLTKFVTKVSDLKKWFKGYKLNTIELIEGAVKDVNVTKLFVSFEGKGGCKIILKPVEEGEHS